MSSLKPRHLAALIGALALATPVFAAADPGPLGPGEGTAQTFEFLATPAAEPNVPVVYIATGQNYPDALAASAAAGGRRAPVLLVTQTSIPAETVTELTRLGPDSIVIVGGTAVISATVETALGTYTTGAVTRLAGSNRYATAVEVSKANFPTDGLTSGFTMRGDFGVAFTAAGSSEIGSDAFSFGFTLASAPAVHVIEQGDTPPAACPGSAEMPEADPGHLCVYEAHGFGHTGLCVFSPTVNTCPGAVDPFGAAVWLVSSGAGYVYSYGTWAVTSP